MAKITIKVRKPEELVNVWQVAGPFSKKEVSGLDLFDVEFAPEKNNIFSDWEEMPIGKDDYDADMINLQKYIEVENSVAYLKTTVWSEKNQNVIFEIGSDDGVKVWLNNNLVHQNNVQRGHDQGQDIVEVKLEEGWNNVFMKVTQGVGGWGASLAISDAERELIDGLRYK
jgi:hypothetical protein